MLPLLPSFQRDRRVAVRRAAPIAGRSHCRTRITRPRRGLKACIKSAWRRQETGSNHISAYGVWRDHARRAMARVNSAGQTRWHRLPIAGRPVSFFREMP